MNAKQYKNPLIFLGIALLVLAVTCCEKEDPLSLQKTEYTGTNLRIDGYYYSEYSNRRCIMFMYRNGIILDVGCLEKDKIQVFEQNVRDPEWVKRYQKSKGRWGLFVIQDSILKYEQWYSAEFVYRVYVREGIILNDTTFRVTKSYRYDGSEVKDENTLYRFKAFSPKPDSTNPFIP